MRFRCFLAAPMSALVCATLALAGCGGEQEPPRDLVAELDNRGPHPVGFRSVPVTYTTPLTQQQRNTQVLVWYPAEMSEGELALYLVRKSEFAVIDAPPADLGTLPVIMFSHGHQAYAGVFSHFMEHAASHGYIAIAPTHTGNTLVDGDNRQTDIYYLRAFDMRAALDHFQNLTNDPLAGKTGPNAIVMGHSFGGYTAYALSGANYDIAGLQQRCMSQQNNECATLTSTNTDLFAAGLSDDRFVGNIAIDSGDFDLFGASGVATVDIPVMQMVAEDSGHRPADATTDSYWNALNNSNDVRVLLLGGAHNDFIDSCEAGILLRCSTLDFPQVTRLTRILSLAFVKSVLDADPTYDGILDGTVSVSELVEISTR